MNLIGYPWKPYGDGSPRPGSAATDVDTEKEPEAKVPQEDEHEKALEHEDDGTQLQMPVTKVEIDTRDFHLHENDFILNDYTPGCRGCRAIERNLKATGHSRECHLRMAAIFKNGSEEERRRVARAEARFQDRARKQEEAAEHEVPQQVEQPTSRSVRRRREARASSAPPVAGPRSGIRPPPAPPGDFRPVPFEVDKEARSAASQAAASSGTSQAHGMPRPAGTPVMFSPQDLDRERPA